jgi:hypothetical protein
VILRRRDDYARVLRELGGQLFARGGDVDKYFKDEPEFRHLTYSQMVSCSLADIARARVKIRVVQHIREAPDRERVALRRANIRQACHAR